MQNERPAIDELAGKTFSQVKSNVDEVVLVSADGSGYRFFGSHNCRENVSVEHVTGELAYLEGVPILEAEEAIAGDHPGFDTRKDDQNCFILTSYKFATIKGRVTIQTIRWYWSSNGYYAQTVDLERIIAPLAA